VGRAKTRRGQHVPAAVARAFVAAAWTSTSPAVEKAPGQLTPAASRPARARAAAASTTGRAAVPKASPGRAARRRESCGRRCPSRSGQPPRRHPAGRWGREVQRHGETRQTCHRRATDTRNTRATLTNRSWHVCTQERGMWTTTHTTTDNNTATPLTSSVGVSWNRVACSRMKVRIRRTWPHTARNSLETGTDAGSAPLDSSSLACDSSPTAATASSITTIAAAG
jgi:hypothetical protein